jgi:hypothetical protein
MAGGVSGLALDPAKIDCGHEHGVLLMQNGIVYTFGGPTPDFGQLARAGGIKTKKQALHVEQLVDHTIIQVAAGENHCLALDQKGAVWAWGKNGSGQLGPIMERDGNHLLQTQSEESVQKLGPAQSLPFPFGKGLVKYINASRHSSAAVSNRGELFVWGEIGARLQDRAKRDTDWLVGSASDPNPCRPICVKPPSGEEAEEELGGEEEVQVGELLEPITKLCVPVLSRDLIMATVQHKDQLEDLDDVGDAMKERINNMRIEGRKLKKRLELQERDEKERLIRENEYAGLDTFKDMDAEMEEHKAKLNKELDEYTAEITEKKETLRKLVRQIAVIDQHEVNNLAHFERLEAELSSFAKMPGDRPSSQAHQLTTQLNDIRLFREVNRKQKFNLLQQKSDLTSTLMSLESKKNMALQTRLIFDERKTLMKRLVNAGSGGEAMEVDDKVKTTCDMKTNCIRDSDLQRIAADPLGFSGLTEALMISNRTLNDVLSSLREVSMASVSMSADSKLFENSIEYQCALVRQIDNRVKDSMTRATDMMHFFHGEMSSNFEDLPITTR